MIILIPAYEPDQRLVTVLHDLAERRDNAGQVMPVVVVDDGSGPAYAPIFAEARLLGATVLVHEVNRGKGQALRTGFAHIERAFPGQDVVCADSDGQHAPDDILAVAAAVASTGADMVLGVRRFTGPVPARSRIGNTVTALLFRTLTGVTVSDTQTGLRGYPARMLPWLGTITGDRFEYELRLLLAASRQGLRVEQVEIATIYLDENASSHFRPVRDSARIYLPFLAFGLSSFAGFIIDVIMLAMLLGVTGHLVASIVGARLVSASVNFWLNRHVVFAADGRRAPLWSSLVRYGALAAALLGANVVLMESLTGLGVGVAFAKVVTEAVLFIASYAVQRALVFIHPTPAPAALAPTPKPSPARSRR